MAMLPSVALTGAHSKHFSFIVKNSKILALGLNQPYKTHPWAHRYGYRFSSVHSEWDAVVKLRHKHDFTKLRMINIRLSGSSLQADKPILRCSKPCKHCSLWLMGLGFRDIIYSVDTGFEKL